MVKERLLEKWSDALEHADDWTEKNLIEEFITDLRLLNG